MKLSDFDYHLPQELIAQQPAEQRDASRLLVLHRDTGELEHRTFRDIVNYLGPDDLLALNTTKVIPARLLGRKEDTGGEVELLLLRQQGPDTWLCLARPGRRLRPGGWVNFGVGRLKAEILEYAGQGCRLVRFTQGGDFWQALAAAGTTPLPPYITHPADSSDRKRYQTIYAKERGAVAAPTAGLHFTEALLRAIRERGVEVAEVLLHVGWGTFKPVEAEDIRKHRMDPEYYQIGQDVASRLQKARQEGRRVVAIGTTTARALESFAAGGQAEGWTELFIHPPYRFRLVDALVTNFHLPRSTLLMLVSALAGVNNIRKAYAEAIGEKYRFYSYGDAMLIVN